ncbi:MAG: ANTAR domain-containing protein [Treponema sp.]|nr:ANTAR domain-containing protein [Treponema sp.]
MAENEKLEKKDSSEGLSPDQEKELVERAKKALMRYLNMSEPEAHKFIVHQAMNLRRTKIDIAEGILTAYEL